MDIDLTQEILDEMLVINESAEVYVPRLTDDFRTVTVTDISLVNAFNKYHYDMDSYYEFLKDTYDLEHTKDFIVQSKKALTIFYIYEKSIKRIGNLFDKFVSDMNGEVSESYIVQLKGTEGDNFEPDNNIVAKAKQIKSDIINPVDVVDDEKKSKEDKDETKNKDNEDKKDIKESAKIIRKKSKFVIKKENTPATNIPSKAGADTLDKLDVE